MALFKIRNNKTIKINTISIDREKDIQKIFEENLEVLLNIYFLDSEHATSFGGRIDTLGIDKNGAPVIIEYKKNQNDNIINQGLSYLKWLLDHKERFEKLVVSKSSNVQNPTILFWHSQTGIEKFINWNSPRVICIAESYNKFDLDMVEVLPIKIELFRYRMYEDNLLYIDMATQKKIRISIPKVRSKSKKRKKNLQQNYTIEEHLNVANEPIKKIYLDLREKIKGLDETIIEEPKAKYIAYKLTTNFVDIIIFKNSLKVFLNIPSGKLKDIHNLARDLTKPKPVGHWGNGDYEIKFHKPEIIDKVFELIKQSYTYNK